MMIRRLLNCVYLTICFSSCAQDRLLTVPTDAVFSNFGDYNSSSNCFLYFGIDVNEKKKEVTRSSVRVRFLETGKEIVLQNNVLTPAIGWLDRSHVLIEASNAVGEERVFGNWKTFLIRYDVFTHQQDTLPSSWYNSDNSAENFLASDNRLFYTIAYGSEEMKTNHWIEYSVATGESRIIKKYDKSSFSILTYQYLPSTKEIIYVKGKGKEKEIIMLSLLTGEEKIITTIPSRNIEESSAIADEKFYYIVRELPEDGLGYLDWKKVRYLLKSLDLKTGRISEIYASKDEITKISPYKENTLMLSIQGNLKDSISKIFDLPSGGEVSVGLDFKSQVYELKL